MRKQKHAKSMLRHDCSQYELSKTVLNNLQQFDVSPAAKLVLLYLIDCYNPKRDIVYPKQKTIANKLGISESSVKRAIKEIAKVGAIVYETKCINHYKLTSKIFSLSKLTPNKVQKETLPCVNLNPHEHTNKTNKKHIHKERPKQSNQTYKQNDEILNKLLSWNFSGADFILRKYGSETIEHLIKIVEDKKPNNNGAYLRKLLENPQNALKENKKELTNDKLERLIKDKSSFINNKQLAEIQYNSYSTCHIKNEKTLSHLAELQIRYNFPENYIMKIINKDEKLKKQFNAITSRLKQGYIDLGYEHMLAV